MHVFLGVDCKTNGCKGKFVLAYLGEEPNVLQSFTMQAPSRFRLHCLNCDETHRYSFSEIHRMERPEPPPSDFRNHVQIIRDDSHLRKPN